MFVQAFNTPFLPAHPHVAGLSYSCFAAKHCFGCRASCKLSPGTSPAKKPRQLPLLAAGLSAISLLFANERALANERPTVLPTQVAYATELGRRLDSSFRSAVVVKPRSHPRESEGSPFHVRPRQDPSVLPSVGTLLQVEPQSFDESLRTPVADAEGRFQPSPLPPRSSSAANYPPKVGRAGTLPDWAAAGVHRAVHAPDRLLRLRPRVRPATLGLVGVGAFTSGSVFLRSVTRRKSSGGDDVKLSTRDIVTSGGAGLSSVVCMQIPFCVPDREKLLEGLARLADTACLVTPEGMSTAARNAATLLLEESSLLEDSRKFAPHMDVFLADSMASAERRFSAHVSIEDHRIEKICGRNVGYDVSPMANLGQYGVVTLVIATTESVDLGCYDDGTTVIQRLRDALNAVCRLNSGDVAGMELRWVPETSQSRSLTRAQVADAFPSLRVV